MIEMRAWQIVVGVAGVIAFAALAGAVYYALSFLVLTLAGRLLPLAGRRRRRD